MVKHFLLLIVVLVLLGQSIPLVQSLALSGRVLSPVSFIPGTFISNHYVVSGSDYPVQVALNPGPFSNVTISPVINNEFDLLINFPEQEKVPPGTYSIGLLVQEIPPGEEGGGIGTSVGVAKVISVIVYSYDKEIEVRIHAPHINQGSNATFQLSAISQGYPDIERLYGLVKVMDFQGQQRAELRTEERSLAGLQDTTFTLKQDTSSWPTGNYSVQATVFYDGRWKQANTSFLIGKMEVELKSYPTSLEQGFNDVSLTVVNRWGNPLRNVYAKVFLDDEELLHTASIDLDPWQEGVLQGIMKVETAPGVRQGKIILFYEGEERSFPVSFEIMPLPSPIEQQPVPEPASLRTLRFTGILSSSLVAILLVIVVLLLWQRKKTHSTEERL